MGSLEKLRGRLLEVGAVDGLEVSVEPGWHLTWLVRIGRRGLAKGTEIQHLSDPRHSQTPWLRP